MTLASPRTALACHAILVAALLLPAPVAWSFDFNRVSPVNGVGMLIRDARSLGPFERLHLDTAAKVIVRQGDRQLVEVIAEGNVVPLVDTYIEQRTLHIGATRPFRSARATVVITVRRLDRIEAGGATVATIEGFDLPALSLAQAGSSTMQVKDAFIGRLHAVLRGSSTLSISGMADELRVDFGDTSTLQATGLEAKAVSVSGLGSAQAAVWATDSLNVALDGSAGLSFYGNLMPTLATAGAATVNHLGPAPQSR